MNAPTQSTLSLSLRLEFDRAVQARGGEGFARLTISVPRPADSLAPRRGLALTISLDCSGSMSEPAGAPDGSPMAFGSAPVFFGRGVADEANSKMARSKAAVWEAVALLGDDDMASLTAFSSMAQTLFPMSPMTAANKALFKEALEKVQASGGTALHDGWTSAAREAAKGVDRGLLCRVALLTDGEASTGERNPEALAKQSAQLALHGVSTSCFGVGARFNEDLLCAMADAGEGNFRYIPDAMLATAAAVDEVNGLGATAGRKARLRLISEDGAEAAEALNGFDIDTVNGLMRIPTLLAGRPIEVIAKVKMADAGSLATLRAEIEWENRDGILQSSAASLSVALGSEEESKASPQDVEVAGAAAAMLAAKEKLAMAASMAAGDMAAATTNMANARSLMASVARYSGAAAEMASLEALEANFAGGDSMATQKAAKFQSYSRAKNQTVAIQPTAAAAETTVATVAATAPAEAPVNAPKP